MRDIRTVLRMLCEPMPKAARLLEAAIKGLVVSMDTQLAARKRHTQSLENQLSQLDSAAAELEMLRRKVSDEQVEHLKRKETFEKMEARRDEDIRVLQERNAALKAEVEALTPDPTELDGVATIMGDCTDLLEELEEECQRQGNILHDMTTHTADVVRSSGLEDPTVVRKKTEHGRVVELANGEILLRPYGIRDQETQLNDGDIARFHEWCPIVLRVPSIRLMLAAAEGQEIPLMTSDELAAEIDSIYTAKIAADAEGDHSGAPCRELPDFIVEHYLERTLSLERAEMKFCSIIQSIRRAEQQGSLTQKAALFARFLEVCEYDQALPVPVLSAVLRAKRHAQSSLVKTRDAPAKASIAHPGGRKQPRESVSGAALVNTFAALQEGQLAVNTAYESGLRALPSGGGGGPRELFHSLALCADIEGMPPASQVDSGRRGHREFAVLVTLLHAKLQREEAPELREIILRAEKKETITADEFRHALRACHFGDIDDHIWRNKLSPSVLNSQANGNLQLSGENLLEQLGGGASARLQRPMVTETNFLMAVTSAITADYGSRVEHLEGLWTRRTQTRVPTKESAAAGRAMTSDGGVAAPEALPYEEFRSVFKSASPTWRNP